MSSMSLAVSAAAVRPPPCRLMPLLFESTPPWRTTVCTSLPLTAVTSSTILPSLNLPTRIFGPCRSHMIATVRPVFDAMLFTSAARCSWSAALPCEKLSRTTSTPARIMRSSTTGSLEAGPRVATILVLRGMRVTLTSQAAMCKKAIRSIIRTRFKSRHGRQALAFEKLQKRATRRGDVADLVRNAELVDGRGRISAAGDGVGLRVRDRLGDGAGAVRELVLLEQTHRTVPDDRSSLGDLIGIGARGLRTDVQDDVAGSHVINAFYLCVGNNDICRERHLSGRHDPLRFARELGLGQRLADRFPRREQESIRDAAADDQAVDFFRQLAEHRELGRHLRAADDRRERARRMRERAPERVELRRHQRPG